MKSHDIDNIVKKAMEARMIAPSQSAWSRLSSELDRVEVSNRKPLYRYIGYAASLLLTASLATFIYTNATDTVVYENDLVKTPVLDANDLLQPSIENVLPKESVVVKTASPIHKEHVASPNTETMKMFKVSKKGGKALAKTTHNDGEGAKGQEQYVNETGKSSITIDSDALLMAVTKESRKQENSKKKSAPKEFAKNRMQINSDALLYAVSHPAPDMQAYYAKYKVDRDDVLRHIQKELTKKNLAVDASVLLASVEKTIDEETFKNRFMQVVTGKITALAIAFSNRNN